MSEKEHPIPDGELHRMIDEFARDYPVSEKYFKDEIVKYTIIGLAHSRKMFRSQGGKKEWFIESLIMAIKNLKSVKYDTSKFQKELKELSGGA